MCCIFIVILLLFFNITIIKTNKCEISIEEADECGKHVTFIGDPDFNIPLNDSDLDTLCSSMLDGVKCLQDFGRNCLSAFPKQALGILTNRLRKVILRRCRRRRERDRFLAFAKCLQPRGRLLRTNACVDKHIVQLEYIKARVGLDSTLQAICCTFHQRNDCVQREVSAICDQTDVDYLMKIIDDSTKDVTTFACGRYDSTESCDRHFQASVWQPLKDIADTCDDRPIKHNHKSVLAPILAIITQADM